ncbi:hypothetical protein SAMN05421543_12349 [Alicyclobacillus macrosporangiidus]|uniref:Uncharacterized protein n=1 Tax=Alicyclobacillus macrosporangiidus TaxID=392015 RepID=A0A1I7L271_9BACL|nr:hypothetical protein SAMN05421543_12349 [Alicyclobacillus macrosporangiidus]
MQLALVILLLAPIPILAVLMWRIYSLQRAMADLTHRHTRNTLHAVAELLRGDDNAPNRR